MGRYHMHYDQKMKDEFSERNEVFQVDLEELNQDNFPLPAIGNDPYPCHESHFPGIDHTEFWKSTEDPEGPGFVVSHPYGISGSTLQKMVKFCEENNLDVVISARSWYYPLSTVRVMFKQKDQFMGVV